jgi:hypothetical protein
VVLEEVVVLAHLLLEVQEILQPLPLHKETTEALLLELQVVLVQEVEEQVRLEEILLAQLLVMVGQEQQALFLAPA